jgi:hypothetical protein
MSHALGHMSGLGGMDGQTAAPAAAIAFLPVRRNTGGIHFPKPMT